MNDYSDYPELEEQRKFYSIDSEQNIIGSILIAPETLYEAASLKASSMYDPRHKMIVEACLSLSDDNKPIDISIVAEYFDQRGQLDKVGGLGYLVDIAKNTASISNINSHIRAVNDRAKERAILDAAVMMREAMHQPDMSTDERIGEAQRVVNECLSDDEEIESISTVNDALRDYLSELDNRFENGVVTGLLTGLTDLDKRWSGLSGGDFVLIGGRPGMGKTTVATAILTGSAEAGKKGYFSSLEMPTKQITQRLIASTGSIDLNRLKSAELQDEDWPKLTAAAHRMKQWNVVFDDEGGVDIADLCSRWRAESRKNGLDYIMVDYLQLINDRSESRRFDVVSAVSRKLKAIAKELDVPIIVLSQLSRQVEQRPDRRPNNSDLRESGQLEQDADIICFCYRDEYYNDNTVQKGVIELITSKFRDGEAGTDYFNFVGSRNQIKDFDHSYVPPEPEQKQYQKKGF
jgi:replicative DNA helicase